MELCPGIPLGLAPRFQNRLGWIERVRINGGVETDAGHFYPRRDWRRARDEELELLLAEGEAPHGDAAAPAPGRETEPRDALLACSHVGLLNLPSHVRREWWAIAEGEDAPTGDAGRYRAFVDGVIEFLRFKQLPLPARCRVDVMVSRPGQTSTRWDPASGRPGGLGFNVETGSAAFDRVAGIINLGDEPTHLVLLNLAPAAMAGMLGRPWPAASIPGRDLLCRFFTARPTYPLLSVRLEAGDGLWLPTGVVYDVCTLDKREVDVALTILGAAEGEA